MKYLFTIVLGLHGLIHLMGFVNAFYTTDINMQVLGISKPIGALWLIVCVLFIIASSQFFTGKNWFYIALIAVIISQFLILLFWKETKFGTILNVIILMVSLSKYSRHRFEKMVQKESKEILLKSVDSNSRIITKNDINNLPEIVQLWLTNSGVLDKKTITSVKLKQQGRMLIKPNGKWMPFEATQYFNVQNPSFVWSTTVQYMPFLNMIGRDKLLNGEGEMLIKLEGLIPVVNESDNDKINSGTMIRFLSEICWFPTAAINDYIVWENINETSAKATFTFNDQSVSGVFRFTRFGELISFEADRYYGGGKTATLEKWFVETLSFKEFSGLKIPNKSKVTWKLAEGDFHWLTVQIKHIDYNILN